MLRPDVPLVDSRGIFDPNWFSFFFNALRIRAPVTLDYGATIATDVSRGDIFIITATDTNAFTISAPTYPVKGQVVTYVIKNNSGGTLGTPTWDAVFKMAAFTKPANGFNTTTQFHYDGTNWIQRYQNGANIPN